MTPSPESCYCALIRQPVPSVARLAGLVLVVALMPVTVAPSHAWSADGHRLVARLATASTPADLPDFFRGGSERVAAFSIEPDVLRLRDTPHLRAREYPEHYLDSELLDGAVLPDSRSVFLELLQRKSLAPTAVGMLPYAIVEATEHLAIAFAEHRARPDDVDIRTKALYLAGVLSHYSADLSQPLHTTIHHNGRARPDMSSPRTG
ncbi:MAG: hypothetical protein OEM62_12320, partial [Acidobacteriota bacterium]|nr:hypothetical protein [Acidobacteriota bacterium]